MKKWLAPIFGFVPFLYGILATFSALKMPSAVFITGSILAILFLLLWWQLAKIANFYILNPILTVLYMHIPGIVAITLLTVNTALEGIFLPEWLLNICLLYIMPTASLGAYLAPTPYVLYFICLLFSVCAAYLGCIAKRRHVK